MTENKRVLDLSPEAHRTLNEWADKARSVRHKRSQYEYELDAGPWEGNGYTAHCEHAMSEGREAEVEAWRSLACALVTMIGLGGRMIASDATMIDGANDRIAYGVVMREDSNGSVTWSVHS